MAVRTSLAFAGAARLAELLRAGEATPTELVDLFLGRIERLDPQLNAFRKVFAERARLEAEQATARLRAGDTRPLLGLPVAVKDEMGVRGEVRTDGSSAAGGPEAEDWEIVRRLRAAGAVILGVTSVPELTIWPWTESATFGYTRNPWDLQRTPGGSSGGSAAAVAAGLVPLATASDGGGSIRIPAACCGLVGLKTQRGRIPYAPLPEHWNGLSVLGFVGRSVADVALGYEAVTGEPWSAAAEEEPRPLRVAVSFAVPKGVVAKVDPAVRRGVEETAEALRGLGHEVVERDPDYGLASLNFSARYLTGITADARSMAHPERLEPRTKAAARFGRLVGRRGLDRAQAALAGDTRRINAIFDDVDVLLTPVITSLPLPVGRYTGSGAMRTLDGRRALRGLHADVEPRRQPRPRGPGGHGGRPPAVLAAHRRSDGEPLLLALAAQLERAQGWTSAVRISPPRERRAARRRHRRRADRRRAAACALRGRRRVGGAQQVHADRPGLGGRPRGRGGDPRPARAAAPRRRAARRGGRRRPAGRARPDPLGRRSARRARSTSSFASRSGASASRARTNAARSPGRSSTRCATSSSPRRSMARRC
jgi:amidase